jgi:hypothetical protein
MTDEIIKGLENVKYHLPASSHKAVIDDAIDYINEQRAEIERLKKYNTDVAHKHYDDGIKEFSQELKDRTAYFSTAGTSSFIDGCLETIDWYNNKIDDLVKEMAGADDG